MSTKSDLEAELRALRDDNDRLRRLLEKRNAASELRHRLRSTMALLRSIIRNSARSSRNVEGYAAHIEDRLDALASAQAMADVTGEIEVGGVLAEALRRHGASEGRHADLSGPLVYLQPRAGQVFALVAHELAANALQYGALTAKTGRIEATWRIDAADDRWLNFEWKETGYPLAATATCPGFGMEVLQRLAPSELRAAATWDLEKDGLRCTLSFELTDAIGRAAEE